MGKREPKKLKGGEIPISPSLNIAALGGDPFWVDVTTEKMWDGRIVIRYGGMVIPDGSSHGEITVFNGQIEKWEVPNTGQRWPEAEGKALKPLMKGRWPDEVYDLVNF